MEIEFVALTELCNCYEIEPEVLEAFAEAGLIAPERRQDALYLAVDELPELESLLRLFLQLGLDLEGLDTVRRLRRQILTLQAHVSQLQYRLQQAESLHRKKWAVHVPG